MQQISAATLNRKAPARIRERQSAESTNRHRRPPIAYCATNGQTAGPLAVVLSRHVENVKQPRFICAHRRAKRGDAQISNDRKSGEGRCARLKCRASRRDRDDSDKLPNARPSERKRHRQVRCAGQERSREMDVCADRAIIVCVTDRLLCRRRRRGRLACGSETAVGVPEVAQMDVAERQGDLHRQREQRESRAGPNFALTHRITDNSR